MLIPFAHAVGAAWAPVLYCVAVTVLQASFCLGASRLPRPLPHAHVLAHCPRPQA